MDMTSSSPAQPWKDYTRTFLMDMFGNPLAESGNQSQSQNNTLRGAVGDTTNDAVTQMKLINDNQMKATMEAAMNNFLLSLTQMLAKQITNGGNAIKNAMG